MDNTLFFALPFLVFGAYLVVKFLDFYGRGVGPKNLRRPYRESIAKYMAFYNALPPASRRRFEHKVQHFINSKEFIPRGMNHVTDEMKALIAGSAVQLTFGLRTVSLRHFKRILVYPDSYYSTINRTYHKGEVNPRYQAIVLSWKAFVEGYMDHKDGRNLGLHEMAHALLLENFIENGEAGFFDKYDMDRWNRLAYAEIAQIKAGNSDLFRAYGAENLHEFFAVAVEVYFEKPHEFNAQRPDLYKTLSNLLRQDPIRLSI